MTRRETSDPSPLARMRLLQWILFALLGSTTLVITINSYDSGLAKTPLLLVLSSFLVAVYFFFALRAGELRFRPSRADVPVLVFCLLLLVSAWHSGFSMSSWRALELWMPFIVCFFAGTQLFRDQDAVRNLAVSLAVISSVVVGIGLIQYFFSSELFLNFFIDADRRVTSTLTNSSYLSAYIVLVFPLLLAFAVGEPRRSLTRRFLIALLISLAFLLLATSTRSSIAAFLVSMLVLGLFSMKMTPKLVAWGAAALLTVVLAVVLTPHLAGRIEASFRNDPSSTFARRVYFWSAGYNAWKAAPVWGHGIGSYENIMVDYRSPDYWTVKSEDLVPHAHNDIIETAVDLGGIGAILYLAIGGIVLFPAFKPRHEEKNRERWMRIGLCCSLLAIFIDNLANMSLRIAPVGATAWLLLGVAAATGSPRTGPQTITLRAPEWLGLLTLGAWGAFTVFYLSLLSPRFAADEHLIKGSLAVASGRIPEATQEYAQAADADPSNPLALSNLALLLLQTGHPAEALTTIDKLQRIFPHYPKSNLVAASALQSLRRYPEAIERIQKELLFRDHPEAYYFQAAAYMGLGDSAREMESLESLLRADIRGKVTFELGPVSERLAALAVREGDLRKLVEVYHQLAEAFPSDTSVSSMLNLLAARLEKLNPNMGPTEE